MFVRYVVARRSESPWLADGVITELSMLCSMKRGGLSTQDRVAAVDICNWIGRNLAVPPFNRKAGPLPRKGRSDCVCWFRQRSVHRFTAQMRRISSILRRYGRTVRVITARYPGRILYRDAHQIVAMTPTNHHRLPNGKSRYV